MCNRCGIKTLDARAVNATAKATRVVCHRVISQSGLLSLAIPVMNSAHIRLLVAPCSTIRQGSLERSVGSYHGEDSNQHEPAADIGIPSCPALWREDCSPTVLSTSHRISRAHLNAVSKRSSDFRSRHLPRPYCMLPPEKRNRHQANSKP